MIRRNRLLDEFEREQVLLMPPNYIQNLRIVEALLEEARILGVFPSRDPLDGIDVDLRIARALNVRPAS